jgi:hypothetical protein
MIREVIVSTMSLEGCIHLAPMGIHVLEEGMLLMPFRPSTTLENVLATGVAVMNATDDVRVFSGCLTGRRDWPCVPSDRVVGCRLESALSHTELKLQRVEEDPLRPKLYCTVAHEAQHRPFKGFNRAQFAVIEAAILVSRLDRLPLEKIQRELETLAIALEKTAGPLEHEAWSWLMDKVRLFMGEE